MYKASMLIIGLTALGMTSCLFAAEVAVRPPLGTVTKVAAVTARDGSGRVQRFADAGNREFAVRYDEQQRVRSVEASRGPHINDIVSIGYGASGKLAAVTFRAGYVLFFDHRSNGAQVIRDSRGGALLRSGTVVQPLDGAMVEESTKLGAAVAELEVLMGALGQPVR